MKIMSFNVQNTFKKPSDEKILGIINTIVNEDPDIVGIQELTPYLKGRLAKELKNYTFYGRTRFGGIPIIDEYNILLVKKNIAVVETNTQSLGKRPDKVRSKNLLSAFPRICTSIVCVIEGEPIKVVNTHLDHVFKRSRIFQLSVLSKIFKTNDYPLVIMGDFNMHSDNKFLNEFVKTLNLVDAGEQLGKTCKESLKDEPIDHFLIDKRLKVDSTKKIEIDISDHFPIVCSFEIKKDK